VAGVVHENLAETKSKLAVEIVDEFLQEKSASIQIENGDKNVLGPRSAQDQKTRNW
jgi:hypothetical protein